MSLSKKQITRIVIGIGISLALGVAVVAALVAMFSPFGGSEKLNKPEQCHTALLTTTSCTGEDTSFQECHYYFRADGIPKRDVCDAFLKSSSASSSSASADAGLPPNAGQCDETTPGEWKRDSCERFKVPSSYMCFSCASNHSETARHLVQAFTESCDRAIVIKGCNMDITNLPNATKP